MQAGNNRNDHFRYFLGVRVRLIKVSFTVNKGNKFGDLGYCSLNRGCPLNTGFTVHDKAVSDNVQFKICPCLTKSHPRLVLTGVGR